MQASPCAQANAVCPELGDGMGTLMAEIAKREHEVSALREKGLNDFRKELEDSHAKMAHAQLKLDTLKDDFQYNLGLLDERDRDLERCEQLLQDTTLASVEKDELLSQMRAELTQLQSELNIQRTRAAEAETMCKMQRLELAETAESDKLAIQELLLCQREEGDAQRRKLQRALAEVEDELVRQRWEMNQNFADNTRLLEAEYKARADDTLAAADTAKALADERGHDVQLLQERVQLLETKLREKDEEIHKSRLDLRDSSHQREQDVRKLQARNDAMTVQFQSMIAEGKTQEKTFLEQLEQAEAQVSSLRTEICKERSSHAQQLEMQQHFLCESAETVQRLQVELSTCQAALQITRKDMEEKLTASSSEMHSQRTTYEAMARVSQEKHEAEIAQLKHSIWEQTTELTSMRSKMENLQCILEERRADITRYREEVQTSRSREDELKRQLVQSHLQLDEVASAKVQAAEVRDEELIKSLTEQRDNTNKLCQDLEHEVEHLRHRLQPTAGRSPDDTSMVQINLPNRTREKRSPLHVTIAEPASLPDQHNHRTRQAGSACTKPETGSELASPSTIASIPPSPDYTQIQQSRNKPTDQPMERHAANHSVEGSRRYTQVMDSLEKLIRGPPEERDIVRTSVDSLAESENMEMENHRLRMAVIELETQQERLKATISMMAEEMQTQIHQVAKPVSNGARSVPLVEINDPAQRPDDGATTCPSLGKAATALDEFNQAAPLQRHLNRCKLEIDRLTAENERLMEVGNELRAERNMAAQAQDQYLLYDWQCDQAKQVWTDAPNYDHPDDTPSDRIKHLQHVRSMSAPAGATRRLEHGNIQAATENRSSGALSIMSQPLQAGSQPLQAGTHIKSDVDHHGIADMPRGMVLQPWGSADSSPEKATQTYRTTVSGKASARELPSQKAKLAKLKRRHTEASQRAKTRNYNLRD